MAVIKIIGRAPTPAYVPSPTKPAPTITIIGRAPTGSTGYTPSPVRPSGGGSGGGFPTSPSGSGALTPAALPQTTVSTVPQEEQALPDTTPKVFQAPIAANKPLQGQSIQTSASPFGTAASNQFVNVAEKKQKELMTGQTLNTPYYAEYSLSTGFRTTADYKPSVVAGKTIPVDAFDFMIGYGVAKAPIQTFAGLATGVTGQSLTYKYTGNEYLAAGAGLAGFFVGAKGVTKVGDYARTFGRTYIPPEKVFEPKALKMVESGGKSYPKSPTVKTVLKEFKTGSKKATEFFPESKNTFLHAAPKTLPKNTLTGAGSSESPILSVSPYGKGNPSFLGIGGEKAIGFSFKPFSSPTEVVLKAQTPVKNIPREYLTSQAKAQSFVGTSRSTLRSGTFKPSELTEPIGQKGQAYVNPARYFGKSELEAGFVHGTKLEGTSSKYFTKIGAGRNIPLLGKRVPLQEYNVVLEGKSTVGKTTTLGKVAEKQFLSSSSYASEGIFTLTPASLGLSASKPYSRASSSTSFVSIPSSSSVAKSSGKSFVSSFVPSSSGGNYSSSSGTSYSPPSTPKIPSYSPPASSSYSPPSSLIIPSYSPSSSLPSSPSYSYKPYSPPSVPPYLKTPKFEFDLPNVKATLGESSFKRLKGRRIPLQVKSSDLRKVLFGERNIVVNAKTSKSYFKELARSGAGISFPTQEEYLGILKKRGKRKARK